MYDLHKQTSRQMYKKNENDIPFYHKEADKIVELCHFLGIQQNLRAHKCNTRQQITFSVP